MRRTVNREYQGGYVAIRESILLELIAHYRKRKAGFKDLVRVFAAIHEKKGLPKGSKVDLYRIINCKANQRGCRRLSHSRIITMVQEVRSIVTAAEEASPKGRKRPVSRKALQAVAQGRLSASEALILLFYASRRITQSKEMQRLNEEERYGRFKYAELRELTGLEKARIGEAVSKLCDKGFLHVVHVHQSNVNAYGLCFVDGWLISLYRTMRECIRKVAQKVASAVKKTATAVREKSTTPLHKTAGLKNSNLKTSIQKKKDFELKKGKHESWQDTLARLRKKCDLMQAGSIDQPA